MKKLFLILTLISITFFCVAQENHYDFSLMNSTGYYTFYRIIDADNQLVEITYPCNNGNNYWYGYEKPSGKLIINSNVTYDGIEYHVTAIGDHAYYNCVELSGNLDLPGSVETIGDGAFCGCSRLVGKLDLTYVKYIGDSTFYNCSQFTDRLIIPDEMTSIGKSCFENCGFTGMCMLPASLLSIGDNALKGCSKISLISVKAENPPVVEASAFDNMNPNITVYIPYNTTEIYKNANGWSRFSCFEEKSIYSGKAVKWAKGDGTSENPYLIESAENLAWLAKSVNETVNYVVNTVYSPGGAIFYDTTWYSSNVYQDTCFRLVIDMDLQGSRGFLWEPIGWCNNSKDYSSNFSGIFDGDGHSISNYAQNSNSLYTNYGLFGKIEQASIKNLNVVDFNINISSDPNSRYSVMSGGLAGYSYGSTITNCHTSGVMKNGLIYMLGNPAVGGIVGKSKTSNIEYCTSTVDITCRSECGSTNNNGVGGIVGTISYNDDCDIATRVYHCGFSGSIVFNRIGANNTDYLCEGGIVGIISKRGTQNGVGKIENCYCKGTLSGTGLGAPRQRATSVGGIVGHVDKMDTLIIINCFSNDSIMTNSNQEVAHCGGIIGLATDTTTLLIKNCYHVGYMDGYNKGGIIAKNTGMTIVRNCYYDRDCCEDNGFGFPMEKIEMKTEAFCMQLNNGSTVFKMDTEPYQNDGFPIFGTDGLIFVGAEWYYEILNEDGSITYQDLRCVGDTAINSKRAKVIVKSNTLYDKDLKTEVTHEYLYEENGVVYWWNKTLAEFTVLYDFSAIEGEEWIIKVGEESITMHVYEVENQIINGLPYRKLTVADDDNIFSGTIVSNIGHLTSFFPEKLIEKSSKFSVEQLRCYWLDGNLIYKIGDMDCDEIYQNNHFGVDETATEMFAVYPNPANGIITIKFGDNETFQETSLRTMEYEITNISGQSVMKGMISGDNQQINVEGLENGMYFLVINNQIVKIIKN